METEVNEKVLRAAFIPFGDISEVQIPIDYATEKHRGFAFIEYELPEDAQAAIDNMNDSEMFGRTLRVNIAKPLRIKENSSRPVWQDEEWLQVIFQKIINCDFIFTKKDRYKKIFLNFTEFLVNLFSRLIQGNRPKS